MSLLSGLFSSSKKVNLTPDIQKKMPSQVNPEMYGSLSTLAKNYQNGVGTGFGEDYVSKTTNPVADSMRRNYRNVTAPTINSNYSSRGLGKSSLAANAQGLAEGNVESDIGNIMAQFYQLNEAQKKTDTQFGASLGQNILTNDVNSQHSIADDSKDLANATAKDARTRETQDNEKATKLDQMALGAVTGGSGKGGFTGALGGIANGMNSNIGSIDLAELLKQKKGIGTNIAGVQ